MEDMNGPSKELPHIKNCHKLRRILSAAGHKISHHLFLLQSDKANVMLAQIHYTILGSIPIDLSSSTFYVLLRVPLSLQFL